MATEYRDPVCKCDLDEKPKYKCEYEGKEVYFCSPVCKEKFEKNPLDYIAEYLRTGA